MEKFGIYIHIPFCKKACSYCNFYYSTTPQEKNIYAEAVCKELEWRAKAYGNLQLQSIYFGGGTPSLLEISLLQKIIDTIHTLFQKQTPFLEITLEANPNDIDNQRLQSWKNMGINRLSIGIQSFYDSHLQFMNRSHTATESFQCIARAQEIGFENISADLIFGFPLLSNDELKNNVQQLIDFKIPHISAYALTIEPKTLLFYQTHHQQLFSLDEEQQSHQFLEIEKMLEVANYGHYEISNYAQPHFESIHNSAYWNHTPYLGIGASAHSFLGQERCWNIANHHLYCKQILEKNTLPIEKEILTQKQQFNEYILLSLRQSKGINLEYVAQYFGSTYCEHIFRKIDTLKPAGWLVIEKQKIMLSKQGKLYCDKIVVSLWL